MTLTTTDGRVCGGSPSRAAMSRSLDFGGSVLLTDVFQSAPAMLGAVTGAVFSPRAPGVGGRKEPGGGGYVATAQGSAGPRVGPASTPGRRRLTERHSLWTTG